MLQEFFPTWLIYHLASSVFKRCKLAVAKFQSNFYIKSKFRLDVCIAYLTMPLHMHRFYAVFIEMPLQN